MVSPNSRPLVSVIVTTFERQRLLQETIASILGQTFRDFELIVVDNHSNYDFFSLIRSFGDDRLAPHQNSNLGIIAVNRNFAIKKARGTYLAFCDDDDYWARHKLERQLEHFDPKTCVGIGSQSLMVGDLTFHRKKRAAEDAWKGFPDILKRGGVALSSLLVKNESFFFDEAPGFRYVEDFDFQLNITYRSGLKIKELAEPLVHYRIHPARSGLSDKDVHQLNVLDKYRNYIPASVFDGLVSGIYLHYGIDALKNNDPKAGRYLRRSLKSGRPPKKALSILALGVTGLPPSWRRRIMETYYQIRSKARA
jgi:glycosyltransferase involved in cell wall biosynthesis